MGKQVWLIKKTIQNNILGFIYFQTKMALTPIISDDNLFDDDFNDEELNQIFDLTNSAHFQVEDSESGCETIYIEQNDENNENDKQSLDGSDGNQICTNPSRQRNKSQKLSCENLDSDENDSLKLSDTESFREDELELTSCDENLMSMSQEVVETYFENPEICEEEQVQDTKDYGEPEIAVHLSETELSPLIRPTEMLVSTDEEGKVAYLRPKIVSRELNSYNPISPDVPEILSVNSQDSDTSTGVVPLIYTASVSTLNDTDEKTASQETAIHEISEEFSNKLGKFLKVNFKKEIFHSIFLNVVTDDPCVSFENSKTCSAIQEFSVNKEKIITSISTEEESRVSFSHSLNNSMDIMYKCHENYKESQLIDKFHSKNLIEINEIKNSSSNNSDTPDDEFRINHKTLSSVKVSIPESTTSSYLATSNSRNEISKEEFRIYNETLSSTKVSISESTPISSLATTYTYDETLEKNINSKNFMSIETSEKKPEINNKDPETKRLSASDSDTSIVAESPKDLSEDKNTLNDKCNNYERTSISKTAPSITESESKSPDEVLVFPVELSKKRSIAEDHDYLAVKMPLNFKLRVEDTNNLVQKSINQVISIASSIKGSNDKHQIHKSLSRICNHINLLQDITHTNDETEILCDESTNSKCFKNFIVKEEHSIPLEETTVNAPNNTNYLSSELNSIEQEEIFIDDSESHNLSLLIDPINEDVRNLEEYAHELLKTASQWRREKETNKTKIQNFMKDFNKKWCKLIFQFDCRPNCDVGTEIDTKMFTKQNQKAKKDILAVMNDSEQDSDDEARRNVLEIVEASYSDALESDLEEEIGKKTKNSVENRIVVDIKSNESSDESSKDDSDKEIDRLCNFKNLGRKISESVRKPGANSTKKSEKKTLNIEELLNGSDEDGFESDQEPVLQSRKAPKTEVEYLKQINEEYKQQLLESSSSENESAISVNMEARDSEDTDEESDSSIIMHRFLSSFNQNGENAKNEKQPSLDSGVDEKLPPKLVPKKNTPLDTEKPTSGLKNDEEDDALDLSMFKSATQRVRQIEELADLNDELENSSSKNQIPNVEDYISLSSDSEDEETTETPKRSRHIRKIMTEAELAQETKEAQKAEERRIRRLEKMSESMSQILSQRQEIKENELILDYDKKNDITISVHSNIVEKLKPHQKEGVRFMYNNCYGPIDDIEKYPGSGCILAHCMGLGKTLQLIALLHTVIRYPRLKTNRILVLCPKSTVLNWFEEFDRWISKIKSTKKMKVFCFEENMTIKEKVKILEEWYSCGLTKDKGFQKCSSWLNKTNCNQAGCLLLGYEAFRSLVNYNPFRKNARIIEEKEAKLIEEKIERFLIDPGADMVVCDEGHVIKNKKSGISKAVSQIKTKRRIILTGTPIQNNLNEYYCMVNFIKPSFLGTEKEFNNLYANPIKSGQHRDSTPSEIRQMKRRTYILHKKLQPFVERKEFTILKDELQKKHEYVLYVPLTDVQKRLYKIYLDKLRSQLGETDRIKGNNLLPDYTYLRKIWTHPRVLEFAYEQKKLNQSKKSIKKLEKNLDKLIERCDEEDLPDDVFDIAGDKPGIKEKWWQDHLYKNDLDTLVSSNKLQIMTEILKQCSLIGDKCLIFSNFVAVLSVVEFFLTKTMNYTIGRDYYRLDGQTPKDKRHQMITKFNREDNKDVKCFLISARAGGQGINLVGANRVIILDTSWNPAADLQSIFRVYRLGQKKTCFVYRLLAMGTMEEKVYSRSVTKQAMSNRVVDEQQVDRHFSYGELAELYTLTDYDIDKRPVPDVPVDQILRKLLRMCPKFIYKYHEHDSLLASNDDENLSEAEKLEAWNQYIQEEKQKEMSLNVNQNPYAHLSAGPYQSHQEMLKQYTANLMNLSSYHLFNSQLNYPSLYPPTPENFLPFLTSAQNLPLQSQLSHNNVFTDDPLFAMGTLANMNPLAHVPQNLSGTGSKNIPIHNQLGNLDLFRKTTGPPVFNSSTEDLLTGMRQKSSNNFMSSATNSSARSSTLNAVTQPTSNNKTSDPVPVQLISSAEIMKSTAHQMSSREANTNANKKKIQSISLSSKKAGAFEEMFKNFTGNKSESSSNVIVIGDDDHPQKSSSTKQNSNLKQQNTSKIVKNSNIGIHYPFTENKGTPVYLPDGITINKIPKTVKQGQPSSTQSNQTATTSLAQNKPGLQTINNRSGTPVSRPSHQISKNILLKTGANISFKPPTASSNSSTISSRKPQNTLTRINNSVIINPVVNEIAQKITKNSGGNTSITAVAPVPPGWKRKDAPTSNPNPKIARLQSKQTILRK
uniref:CSON000136 protein n=1 Tax=Culicoides sonorensis TaxID=179676 RepID=A0A336KEU9_CULSO